MDRKIKNSIRIGLCIIIACLFLTVISQAEGKDKQTNKQSEGKKAKTKETPEFKYDETSKKYILDTPKFLAEFIPHSFTYTPKGKTETGKPITFSLKGFYQGEEQIGTQEASTRLKDDKKIVIFDRKDYRELYESLKRGFVQVYVIETLPYKDRDLKIKAQLLTEYSLIPNGEEGFSVKDGDKTITVFKQRVATDSQSKKLPLKTILKDNVLEIIVPNDYLSEAKFPIFITAPQKGETVSPSTE